ncbi:MAG: mandelate racemase/muconate lactonizing enzyme family protein [Candidatus Dormibacteraeota bacterium]|nr:mandelate racemase/muconate lactonizing enzyme family protein [Candidatus Dormibacteraeota bacterium]MBO0743379.1 mandelate racemase/muconate lactonizing enzyme family protein [Candidatus Dormibacteraeota bacterium]
MKITAVRCTLLGSNPVVRVATDEGVDGYGEIESSKPYLKPVVGIYEPMLLGANPCEVERTMLRIRRLAGSKPWGSVPSAIEMALWDLAGKAAGLPVHRLLGGKVRDRVRTYNGGVRFPMQGHDPADYADAARRMKDAPQGFTIIKQAVGFHSTMAAEVPGFFYGEPREGRPRTQRGLITESGLDHVVACVRAMKEVLGAEVGLALDCGPGWTVPDAIRLGRALEDLHVLWLEDLLGGDYTPYQMAAEFAEVTRRTSIPTHTGEQVYLRQSFIELIEQHAVRIVGPDPADVGGIAELKWIGEFADLHGVLIAPHGVFDGLLGLAAHVQVGATMPDNYIAFEYPVGRPDWWYEVVDGLPDPIVKEGFIEVWDRPGMGVDLVPERVRQHLAEEDRDFFDQPATRPWDRVPA